MIIIQEHVGTMALVFNKCIAFLFYGSTFIQIQSKLANVYPLITIGILFMFRISLNGNGAT